MSGTVFYASAVVIAACIGFMAIGAAYKWDVRAAGYGRWTRVLGAVALMALALVSVGERLDEPLVVVAAIVAGALLAAGFVWAHKTLSSRLSEQPRDGEDRRDVGGRPKDF